MLSTYPFHEKSVPIPPTIPMFSCTKGLREKKMVRFSPKTHESDGLGTDSRGMKGGQPPKSGKFWGNALTQPRSKGYFGKFWGNSLTQPRSKGYFGKFLFLGQQGKFLKRFREIYGRPKFYCNGTSISTKKVSLEKMASAASGILYHFLIILGI